MTRRSLLLGSLGTLRADENDSSFTLGRRNGRFWKMMADHEKIVFVSGAMDAFSSAFEIVEPFKPDKKSVWQYMIAYLRPPSLTLGEMIEELNSFYSVPVRGRIPISFGYDYVKKKAEGASSSELEAMLKSELEYLTKEEDRIRNSR